MMKKLTIGLLTAVVLLASISAQANARVANFPTEATAATVAESAEITALRTRLNEIKAMDKSTMTFSEKKELRTELRSLKREVKEGGNGGVYISVGGLLLIIILLIILL